MFNLVKRAAVCLSALLLLALFTLPGRYLTRFSAEMEAGFAAVEEAAAAGDTFTLSIERINQQIRARVNDRSQSWYDFDLSAVDAHSDYLCLFAARHVLVEFTSVRVDITGTSVRA